MHKLVRVEGDYADYLFSVDVNYDIYEQELSIVVYYIKQTSPRDAIDFEIYCDRFKFMILKGVKMDLALFKKLSELGLRDGILRFTYIDERGRAWAIVACYVNNKAVSTYLKSIKKRG